jgi:anti-anti-sigma regulatory factor
MMRITVSTNEKTTTMKVEGELGQAWVEELRRCWSSVSALKPGNIRLDLSGVHYIDEAGKELLAAIHRSGAEILATEILTKAIVEEITQSEDSNR